MENVIARARPHPNKSATTPERIKRARSLAKPRPDPIRSARPDQPETANGERPGRKTTKTNRSAQMVKNAKNGKIRHGPTWRALKL